MAATSEQGKLLAAAASRLPELEEGVRRLEERKQALVSDCSRRHKYSSGWLEERQCLSVKSGMEVGGDVLIGRQEMRVGLCTRGVSRIID